MRPSTSATATPPPESPAPAESPKPGAAAATKRQRKSAAPLGDVTNLLLPLRPETPAPIKPRRTARRPVPAPSAASSAASSSASVTPALKPSAPSSAAPAPAPAPEPSSSAPVTPAPQPSSASASATPAPQPPSASAPLTPAPQPSSCSAAPAPAPAPETSSAATATPAPKPSFAAVLEEEEGSVFESPTTICTVYARRRSTEVRAERRSNRTITNKGKEPAASCPPLGKSTRNSRKKDTRPVSSSAPCREAKKKRPLAKAPKLPEEFVKKQKAYFADVDAFELAEEEVSESELE